MRLKERNKKQKVYHPFQYVTIFTKRRLGGNVSGTSKENFEGVSSWESRNFADEVLDAKVILIGLE